MAKEVNQVLITGRLTKKPEVRIARSGNAVCELSVVINHSRKVDEKWIEEPCFVSVTLFGKQAEQAGNAGKGSPVFIGGRLKLDMWEKDGQKCQKLKIIGSTVKWLLDPKDLNQGVTPEGPRERGPQDELPPEDNDTPLPY